MGEISMNKVLILASGGWDSSVLIALYKKLNYSIKVMHMSYGQENYKQERSALEKITWQYGIPKDDIYTVDVSIPWSNSSTVGGSGGAYVEMRNLIFLSYAISFCEFSGIGEIALGYIKTEDDYNDTSDSFVEDIRILANRSSGIRISVPLKDMSKFKVYKLGSLLGLDPANTFSCNTPVDGKPCGKCGDCLDWKDIQDKLSMEQKQEQYEKQNEKQNERRIGYICP